MRLMPFLISRSLRFTIFRNASTSHNSGRQVDYPAVSLEKFQEDASISLITLNNPSTRNAIGYDFIDKMNNVIARLNNDRQTRAVILRSQVPKVFCAGANLKERIGMKDTEVAPFVDSVRDMVYRIHRLRPVSIACMEGAALGGGLELALGCDMRVCAHDTRMGLVETSLGIMPGAGGTQTLSRAVGVTRAKLMVLTAQVIDGVEAERIGLVSSAVPQHTDQSSVFEECVRLARAVCSNAPLAVQTAKRAIDEGCGMNLSDGLAVEAAHYWKIAFTRDRREGLRAFVDKRKPVYSGE